MFQWSLHISLRQWRLEIFVSEVFHKPAHNKFRFNSVTFSVYQMGTMHSIKELNIDGRRDKCNKIL